jgi:glycosyltransferase involved in cell wall biosynthesis
MRATHSLVIPVYRNRETLPELLAAIAATSDSVRGTLEVVFVIDGSPDDSETWLLENLPGYGLPTQLISLSRNFGSFTAIRAGMEAASGDMIAVMAADLQESPSVIVDFFSALGAGNDVAIGTRRTRDDPAFTQWSSQAFWRFYRWLVQPEMPRNGVDLFAVNRSARDALLSLKESHTSLVAQLLWVGFRRIEVPYDRVRRRHGRSGWTLRKRVNYLFDSIFAFTDIPISVVTILGLAGTFVFMVLGVALAAARIAGWVDVPGYTAIMVTILFSTSLILLALGIVGNYVWRAYENTKQRPLGIVRAQTSFDPRARS